MRASPFRLFSEPLESRRLLAAAPVFINFQPAGAAVPSGYLADTGAIYGSRGNGQTYGWSTNLSAATRDRNVNSDQRFDTLVHTQRYGVGNFDLAVPNGSYKVRLVAGDPSAFDSIFKFNVEGALVLSGTPTSTFFLNDTTTTE